MNLKIKEIVNCTKGELLVGNREQECENFTRDTREVKKGDTYIGIKGNSSDGNDYWMQALDNGADTVIIQKDVEPEEIEKYKNKNIVKVADTRKALIDIATAKRNLYKDLIVVGVTGSVGKTTTKDIIASVVSQKYRTLKTQGNFNNDIGLPLTILNLRDHEALIIEMGMNHLGEISLLTKIARPTLAVITNIGTSHIGNLGSRENILKAKLEILEGMEEPKIVINNDNDLLNKWNNEAKDVEIHTFGVENKSECMAENIEKHEKNSFFTCNINNEKIDLNIPVGGDVYILNALCATLVGKLLDLSNEQIRRGLAVVELTKKRMEFINIKDNITLINDSYNASFDSMKAAINYLGQEVKANRKIAVLGDMFELGEYTEELHRKVGKEVADNKIDKLFVIGEYSKFIADEAIKNGMDEKNIYHFDDRQELLKQIRNIMDKDDVFLFKASNAMKLFEIVEQLK